eukprot:COSAG05_NODE_216_length_13897_cov_30.273011_2_plen_474_part_00
MLRSQIADRCQYDFDECAENNGGCDAIGPRPISKCVNQQGSYFCAACAESILHSSTKPTTTPTACCHTLDKTNKFHLPCGTSTTGVEHNPKYCDWSRPNKASDLGCIGPADLTRSQILVAPTVLKSGGVIQIRFTAADVNGRFTNLSVGAHSLADEMTFAVSSGLCRPPPNKLCVQKKCQNGARCVLSANNNVAVCKCAAGFHGSRCETANNPCSINPCKNGGKCVPRLPGDYCCNCPQSYAGDRCEIQRETLCVSDVVEKACCARLGRCAGSIDVEHFCDVHCAAVALPFINRCLPRDHSSVDSRRYKRIAQSLHGTCNASRCTTDVICSSSPCKNGGTCLSNGIGGFVCICDPTHRGILCEMSVPMCPTFTFARDSYQYVSDFQTNSAGKYNMSFQLRGAELISTRAVTLFPAELNLQMSTVDLVIAQLTCNAWCTLCIDSNCLTIVIAGVQSDRGRPREFILGQSARWQQ